VFAGEMLAGVKARLWRRGCLWAVMLAVMFLSVVTGCKRDGDAVKLAHIYDPLAAPSARANCEWIEKALDRYGKRHPDVEISIEQFKWDQIDAKLMTDYRAGAPHDLAWTSPQWMAKHFAVGDLLDVSPLLNWSAEETADFSWSPAWKTAERDGRVIGVPNGVHTRVVCFRRDYFEEAGLDPDNPPETLDEILEAAVKLTRQGDGEDVWGLGVYCGRERGTIELAFAPLLWHYGGELWDETTGRAVFASEAGVKAVEFLYDLMHKHKVCPTWCATGTYDDNILEPFLNGRMAMAWGWGSYWIEILEQKGWIQGLFPPTPGGKAVVADVFVTPTIPQAQFTNAWLLSVHAISKHPQEAADLLDFLVQPEQLIDFPDAGLPARRSMWDRPEYQTEFYRRWRRAAEKGRSMPATPHYNELADGIAAAIQEILLQDTDVTETLKRAEDEYNARFAQL